MRERKKIALFDSGGLKCRLAHALVKDQYRIDYCVTLVEYGKVSDHGTLPKKHNYLIDMTGICEVQSEWFKDLNEISRILARLNVDTIILGAYRPFPAVLEQIIKKIGITVVCPLVGWTKRQIIDECLKQKIIIKIVNVIDGNNDLLGKIVDDKFMSSNYGNDLCGDVGQYHTEVQ